MGNFNSRHKLALDMENSNNELRNILDGNAEQFDQEEIERVVHLEVDLTSSRRRSDATMIDIFTYMATRMRRVEDVHIIATGGDGPPFPVQALLQLLHLRRSTLDWLTIVPKCRLRGTRSEFTNFWKCLRSHPLVKVTLNMKHPALLLNDKGGTTEMDVSENWLQNLNQVDTLQSIFLENMPPTTKNVAALAKLCHLKANKYATRNNRQFLALHMLEMTPLPAISLQSIFGKESRLKELRLIDVDWVRKDMDAWVFSLAEALKTNTSLEDLRIWVTKSNNDGFSLPAATALLEVLHTDNSTLEMLGFDLFNCVPTKDINQGNHTSRTYDVQLQQYQENIDTFMHAMQKTGALKSLYLSLQKATRDFINTMVPAIIEGLDSNTSVTDLKILGEMHESLITECTGEEGEGGRVMLPNKPYNTQLEKLFRRGANTTIENITFLLRDMQREMQCEVPKSDEVEFFLTMNHANIKQLIQHPEDRRQWLDFMNRYQFNVEVSYYLLRFNPSVLLQGDFQTNNNNINKRKRQSRRKATTTTKRRKVKARS